MILTDSDILQRIKQKDIEISNFKRERLGSNSYDLTLGNLLSFYTSDVLDCKKKNPVTTFPIDAEKGYMLVPGLLYLGYTNEYTKTRNLCPQLEGKSSLARLGLSIHLTAGFGDIGFEGHWTLEITVVHKLWVYANMPIAQIYWQLPLGTCSVPYNMKKDAKYANQIARPVPSMMHKNFSYEKNTDTEDFVPSMIGL